ncbi:YqaJ viral recombinase family protein [Corynebacterium callunae]|uniref:YqaJ viral recombinase family protein n=1 Tax=Corynebacterium callunae TaxID=1721 RepID=UPI001FFEDDC1|nr:YqaJ viral recombinase family protein [Corynebacterium callunae]MCK2200508.1 YqaJ viral recombinase family protein [Corynebacterium callunae]
MTHEIVKNPPRPGTSDWQRMITASKIPVILGMVPQWQTPSELWMVMSGLAERDHLEGDHLDWGHIAEDSLVAWWKHNNPGWQTGRGEVAYTDTALPFPNLATLDRRARRGSKFHIIECKTSIDAKTWDSEETLPGHVHTQVLAQMGMSGIHTADVVSQLGSTVPKIFPVEWEEDLWVGIVDVVKDFVDSLGNTEPPMPSQDLLDALTPPKVPPAGTVDIPTDEVADVLTLLDEKARIEDQLDHAKKMLVEEYEGQKITIGGKALLVPTKGKFAASRVPEDMRHLMKHPEVMEHKFSASLFAKKFPKVAEIATGETAYQLRNLK